MGHHPLLRSSLENRGKFPFSENRTPDRIPPTSGLLVAAQNAPVGHAGLWISALVALSTTLACPFPVAPALVPTSRLALVDGKSSRVSPSVGTQSALANVSPTLFGLAPLSSALSHHLASLLFTLVDHSLAPVRMFVLKVCSVSCRPAEENYNVKLSVSLASQLIGRDSPFLTCTEWPFTTINCIFHPFMLLSHLSEKLNVVYFTGGPNRPVRNSMRKEIRR